MSDNNELSLLDEDLDDTDYDLGNEDEEALLADDYEIEDGRGHERNQDGFQEYEEPLDDVLDLGVTDGLDDLESEIQENVEDSSLLKKQVVNQEKQFVPQPSFPVKEEGIEPQPPPPLQEAQPLPVQNASYEVDVPVVDAGTRIESEEEEEGGEEGEGRNRFKSERPNIVSLKSGKTYGNIPDSLDNVIPVDEVASQKQVIRRDVPQWRGRRGRGNVRPHFHPHQLRFARFQGPGFGPGPGRGGGVGFVRPPLHVQQQQQPPPQSPQQQLQQPPQQQQQQQQQQPPPPHKILINPHFRGAVQPHPEARLIWDTDPSTQGCGDGMLPFSPRMFMDAPYSSAPQGVYEPPFQQHEPMHGGYGAMPAEPQQPPPPQPSPYYHDVYNEQQHLPMQQHQSGPEYWQDLASQQTMGHDNFYQQHGHNDMYNAPPYPGPGPMMPHEDQPFSMPIDPGPIQGAQQGMFRLPNPGMAPGPGVRFRHQGPYRNFNHQRPRFPPVGQMNGPPRARRMPGNVPIRQALPQQQLAQQSFRSPQKRPSFDGANNNNVVPLTQARFDPLPKRKKRMPDMSNLHEVQTVDTLPSHTETSMHDENEDEETREYRKKIEEQKRLRERILQQKEARRKLAALEKQRELQKKDIDLQASGDAPAFFPPNGDPPQGNAIATIVNRNTVEPQAAASVRYHSSVGRGMAPQSNVTVVPTGQAQVMHMKQRGRGRLVRGRGRGMGRGQVNIMQPHQQLQQPQQQQQVVPVQVAGPVVPKFSVNQAKSETVHVVRTKAVAPSMPAPGQRIVRAAQPNAPKRVVLTQGTRVVQANPGRTVMLRGTNSTPPVTQQAVTQQAVTQQPRRVVQKSAVTQQVRPVAVTPGRTVVSTQTAGITVTAQPQEVPRTKLVAVENLAASTTEAQLRRMCQRVGPVENIQMIPAQRRAVITFANPASAATFLKRYQRKMVDLSLINVTLVVQ